MSDDGFRRWHWRDRCVVVPGPETIAGRLRVLAQNAAEGLATERRAAVALGGWDDEPPRADAVTYCRGAGAPVVACRSPEAFAAAQHAPPLRRTEGN
jgi:hypothetical protein